MTSKDPLPSLESLQQKIDAAQDQKPSESGGGAGNAADTGAALRLGVELAAGIAVGVGIGYGLDRWLGTTPWLLILCFFLGCGAGFLNLKRAVEQLDSENQSATTPRAGNPPER